MLANQANTGETGLIMRSMDTYSTDSTGARIAWARKRKKIMASELARLLGVRNVYLSQLENNHRNPSRQMLQSLAAHLGTTVGFLLMETDDPEPPKGDAEPAPVYFSPEADEAAQLIDAAPPDERLRMLAVLRALVATFSPDGERQVSERVIYLPKITHGLIYGDQTPQRRREQSR